jgi:rubrerythrin
MPHSGQFGITSTKNTTSFSFKQAFPLSCWERRRLAAIHPSLIIDRDFDSLLHACAAAKHSKRAPWNIKTINATEVLKRCTQLHPELTTFAARLTLLAEYRNSTVHFGEVPETETKQLLRAYLAGSSAIIKGLELKTEDIYGEFAEIVAKQLDETLAEVQRTVAEKIVKARADSRMRYAALHLDQLEAVVSVIEGSYKSLRERYRDELVTCPACGHLGIAAGDYDLDWEPEYDDESGLVNHAYPVVTLKPSTFACNICGLNLDNASELVAAGLPDSICIEDVDETDFYEEPDY